MQTGGLSWVGLISASTEPCDVRYFVIIGRWLVDRVEHDVWDSMELTFLELRLLSRFGARHV